MTEEARVTTARYASGEVPQVGDVVRCVDAMHSIPELYDSNVYQVKGIDHNGLVEVINAPWYASRFILVARHGEDAMKDTRWSALRIELQEANDERDRAITLWEEASKSQLHLAAENARLRAAIEFVAHIVLESWWHDAFFYCCVTLFRPAMYIVPPHIEALQDAIYREGGE